MKELELITGKKFVEFDIYKTLEHKINSLYDVENKSHHQFGRFRIDPVIASLIFPKLFSRASLIWIELDEY